MQWNTMTFEGSVQERQKLDNDQQIVHEKYLQR